jgi:hypothetical protein
MYNSRARGLASTYVLHHRCRNRLPLISEERSNGIPVRVQQTENSKKEQDIGLAF